MSLIFKNGVRGANNRTVIFLYLHPEKEGDDAYGGAETEEGIPPWLLVLGVPDNTPSVSESTTPYSSDPPTETPIQTPMEDDPINNQPGINNPLPPNNTPAPYTGGGYGGTPNGGGQTSARIPGMYFYHPDHLGSITMITDGHGQVLVGGGSAGKSHISYRPYGEILRTDSYGPDISKYKYTGQEEDKESGLYYYKARYYDPVIGRFAQADSMAFPDRIQGMNRMMYVEGNPMSYTDDCGTNAVISSINKWVKGAVRSSNQFFKGGIRSGNQFLEGMHRSSNEFSKGGIRSGNQFLEGMHRSSNQFSKGGIKSLNAFNKGGVKSLNEFVRNAGHSFDDARRKIGRAIDGVEFLIQDVIKEECVLTRMGIYAQWINI